MADSDSVPYASRGGFKLAAALDHFGIEVQGLVCADLGSHVGGFVDCLLRRGAARVHAIDTAYGVLGWRLRKDARVVVLERSNAMHVELPERVDLVTIDLGWTRQKHVLPAVRRMLKNDSSRVITLIKPHYEAPPSMLEGGRLPHEHLDRIVEDVLARIRKEHWTVLGTIGSSLPGHAGNREVFALLANASS